MGKVLVIVDVQKEFDEYIQHDLVDALSNYAEKFDTVYQIWDTHNNTVAPTHSFPGQVDSIPKKYGKKHFSDEVKEFIKKIQNSSEEGRTFKLDNEEGYIVRVKNNHDWFYVNPEIVDLISKLKGNKIILAGGADGECLEDVYQTFLAFGLKTHINKKYTYNAKTTEEDSVEEVVETKKTSAFNTEYLLEHNDDFLREHEFEKLIFKVDNESDVTKVMNYVQTLFPDKEISSSAFADEFRDDMSYPNWIFLDLIVLCDTRDYNKEVILNILSNHPNENSLDEFITKMIDKGHTEKYDPNVFTVNKLEEFGALVKTGVRRMTPNYMISAKERKNRFIRESKIDDLNIFFLPNTKKDAEEAQLLLFEIGYQWRSGSKQLLYMDPYNISALIIKNGGISKYGIGEEEEKSMIDSSINSDVIKNIDELKVLLRIKSQIPNYMLSKEERKKRFIKETLSPDLLLLFVSEKDDPSEDYTKAQEYVFEAGGTWKSGSVDVKFIEPPSLRSLTIRGNLMAKIAKDTDGRSYLESLIDSGDFIKTSNLDEFRKLLGLKPNNKPSYMLSAEERRKRFIRESFNDKNNAREIVIKIESIEEYNQLKYVVDGLNDDDYMRSFNNETFYSDNVPYYFFFCVDKEKVNLTPGLVTDLDMRYNSINISILLNNIDDSQFEGVYREIFSISDLQRVKNILEQQKIVSNTPRYMLSAEDRSKRFIRENKNTKEEAFEIIIKIDNQEQHNILRTELGKIDNIYSDELKHFINDRAPYYYFILFNLDNKENSPNGIVSWYNNTDPQSVHLNNGNFNNYDLDGSYEKIFSFNELNEFLRIVRYGNISNLVPKYMLSAEDRSKRFIRENFDPEYTLIFESNGEEENIQAQEFAIENGWIWANGEKRVIFSDVDETQFLIFEKDYDGWGDIQNGDVIFRITPSRYQDLLGEVNDKMGALKIDTKKEILYTNNLDEFKVKLTSKMA